MTVDVVAATAVEDSASESHCHTIGDRCGGPPGQVEGRGDSRQGGDVKFIVRVDKHDVRDFNKMRKLFGIEFYSTDEKMYYFNRKKVR